jgi:hypothetical protein
VSIFRCDKCGCIENTACSNYWEQKFPFEGGDEKPKLCSECDPEIGQWHGSFTKQSAKGLMLASDGFLYAKEDVASDSFKWRMEHQELKVVREITE